MAFAVLVDELCVRVIPNLLKSCGIKVSFHYLGTDYSPLLTVAQSSVSSNVQTVSRIGNSDKLIVTCIVEPLN